MGVVQNTIGKIRVHERIVDSSNQRTQQELDERAAQLSRRLEERPLSWDQ